MKYTKEASSNINETQAVNYLHEIGLTKVREEIAAGLQSKPRYISSKFFYNDKGSSLFEQITELEEYYPTRTEKKILKTIAQDLDIDFKHLNIIELGSGDHSKIRILLQQIPENDLKTITYTPVDISESAVEASSAKLHELFPKLNIKGIIADFIHQLHIIPQRGKRLFCFFGNTIGNLNMQDAQLFLRNIRTNMQQGDSFLLGMDMEKDTSLIENAYNDSLGVTAQFNKNILNVVNQLLETDFKEKDFEHVAFYAETENRIEMHLKAIKNIVVKSQWIDAPIFLSKGETIHTENSHKYTYEHILKLSQSAGLNIQKIITDNKKWFSLIYFKA